MSADNWTQCPKCKKSEENTKAALLEATKRDYGKIKASEYLELVKKAEAPIKMGDNLREDYYMSISSDGIFEASYSALCERCGFKHKFSHKEPIK